MDYCGGGSIRSLIETLNRPLTEDQIAFVVLHTLNGIHYLHTMNIIHRDVKAANILLTGDGQVKIGNPTSYLSSSLSLARSHFFFLVSTADFGVSEQLNSKVSKAKETIGTPLWMAPEVILNKQYDNKVTVDPDYPL